MTRRARGTARLASSPISRADCGRRPPEASTLSAALERSRIAYEDASEAGREAEEQLTESRARVDELEEQLAVALERQTSLEAEAEESGRMLARTLEITRTQSGEVSARAARDAASGLTAESEGSGRGADAQGAAVECDVRAEGCARLEVESAISARECSSGDSTASPEARRWTIVE